MQLRDANFLYFALILSVDWIGVLRAFQLVMFPGGALVVSPGGQPIQVLEVKVSL